MSLDGVVGWAFAGVFLVANFYIARALYRRNPVATAYLPALALLWGLACATGVVARGTHIPLCFLAYLGLTVLFSMLVGRRVRETGRIIRGRLALLVWLAGGVAMYLSVLAERLHAAYPARFAELPPWAFGVCAGTLMLGMVFATLQLRDAEWYFN